MITIKLSGFQPFIRIKVKYCLTAHCLTAYCLTAHCLTAHCLTALLPYCILLYCLLPYCLLPYCLLLSTYSITRVKHHNRFAQISGIQVRINLGGRDAFMPEQILHNLQISPTFDQMRCK